MAPAVLRCPLGPRTIVLSEGGLDVRHCGDRMKIALIVPKLGSEAEKSFYDYAFYSTFLCTKKYISCLLAIPTLAALTPPEHEVPCLRRECRGD